MPRKIRLSLIGLAIVLVLTLVWLLVFNPGQSSVRQPLPSPNGHDDFVQAGQATTGVIGDYIIMDLESVRSLVASNAPALHLLRLGLTRHCAMPLDSALTNNNSMNSEMSTMKRLAQLLAAEGRMLELSNRPAEAAQSYTQVIRFGNEMSHGGPLIARMVGMGCETLGTRALVKLAPKLSSAEARPVIAELERIDATRVPWAETVQGENDYVRLVLRNYRNPLVRIVAWWNTRRQLKNFKARLNTHIAQERLLATELALRCCQAEGHPLPARLDELVTNYLSRLPTDPFTAQVFAYRPRGTNWLVYSVGPDGVDDGGKPAARGSTPIKGDLRFDAP